jgi:predicted phosphate transport protein (TIGR00153 family)
MRVPFGQAKALENQVDEFLDVIVKGSLAMKKGVTAYLEGDEKEFGSRIEMVGEFESQADELRKRTETMLYTYSLIPESRGDVLGLLETMDNVIDRAKEVLQSFAVQRPKIEEEYREPFLELTDSSILAVENVVSASRCYFRDVQQVRDHINKVDFYESEADRAGLKLKRLIFGSELDLARKLHLRYFAEQIESISDIAEEVGERLSIAAIKRTI